MSEPGARGGAGLAGRVVLITRPAGQGERLADLVRGRGQAFDFPTLAIEPVTVCARRRAARHPEAFSWAVSSANAVAHERPLLPAPGMAGGRGAAASVQCRRRRARGVPLVLPRRPAGRQRGAVALAPLQQVSGSACWCSAAWAGASAGDTCGRAARTSSTSECYGVRLLPTRAAAPRLRRGELR
jgi:hypothetical protein